MSPDDSFPAFVAARWTPLVRYAYLLTGDRSYAEDLVQIALERTWRRWPHVRADRPEVYVRAALANLATSRWRRLGRRVTEVPLGLHEQLDVVDERQVDHALRDLMWRELQALPPRMRAVVVLRIWEDLSVEETAQVLGCSRGSVKSQLSRALTRLRDVGVLRESAGLPLTDNAKGATR